jgi:folate-binding protein YgfZ
MVKGAICQLSQFGLIQFFGEEAQVFLHNQLTCDVAGLKPGGSTYGSYCTPKGRVLATFPLWRSEHGFFLQLPSSLCEPIRKQISKYILRSKVKAADASADWVIYGVAGKDASALVQCATGLAPKAVHGVAHSADTMVIWLPGDRYEIVAARENATRIRDILVGGAETTDPDYWEWLDIRAGVPVILPETQEEFVPQMVNLDLIGGVSFEKGCYPGQEIVSRMHHRGTLKQRMYLASIASNGHPQPADKLYSPGFGEQACGTIVNAARSPEAGYEALAVIQISGAERSDIRWKSPTGPALKLLKLPYSVT